MTNIRRDFQIGEKGSFYKTITEADVTMFAGIVGDFNRIHVDAEYARQSSFGQRTAHEMLAGSLIATVLSTVLPGAGYGLLRQQIEFLEPVFLGDSLTAFAEVLSWNVEKRIITLRTGCHNQNQQEVLAGEAVLMLLDR